ncbi:MAG TPA: YrdB family protein [Burkholderiales bacterium]|nr:YrdB family protein [Burkholderiales bacterium]
MGFHPANLAIRFLLELSALGAMAFWGWQQGDGSARYVFALLVPLVAAAAWGVFAVPGDRSRSGKAPVAVPGVVRLGVEAAFFAFAVFALYKVGSKPLSAILAAAVFAHYVASFDRVTWLLRA